MDTNENSFESQMLFIIIIIKSQNNASRLTICLVGRLSGRYIICEQELSSLIH